MNQQFDKNAPRNALKAGYELLWYQIKAVLGQGAFGITYLARDVNLNRMVAIKEFLPGQYAMRDGDDTVRPVSEEMQDRFKWGLERFIEEARILDQFDHPNIVRVMNTFEANNTAYMVMRYEQGVSLKEILVRQKFLDESDLLNILFPILDGLELMHDAGYVHRDIKPSNIFVRTDGTPVLLDFGSARQSMQIETHTLTSLVSPGYAPIEQYVSKSDKQGPWTDIYGMAATLYRTVTGVAPADAISRGEALTGNEKDTYIACRELADQRYSDQFVESIDQGLRFLTRERPQSVEAWRESIISGESSLPEPIAISGQISNEIVSVVRESLTQTATRVYNPNTAFDVEGGVTAEPDTTSIEVAHKQGFHRGLKLVIGLLIVLAGAFLATNFEKVRDVDQQGYISETEDTIPLMPVPPADQETNTLIDPISTQEVINMIPETSDVRTPTSLTPQVTLPSASSEGSPAVPLENTQSSDQMQTNALDDDPLYPESQGQLLPGQESFSQPDPLMNQTEPKPDAYILLDNPNFEEEVPEATVVSELPPGAILLDEEPEEPVITQRAPVEQTRPASKPIYRAPETPLTTAENPASETGTGTETPPTIEDKTSTVTREGVTIEEYAVPKRPEPTSQLRTEFEKMLDFLKSKGAPASNENNEAVREQLGGGRPVP